MRNAEPYVKLPHDVTVRAISYEFEILPRDRGEGVLFGRYARLVGAPNSAPSLRSVAGLLLALALQSGLRGHPRLSLSGVVSSAPCKSGRVACVRRLANLPQLGAPPELALSPKSRPLRRTARKS